MDKESNKLVSETKKKDNQKRQGINMSNSFKMLQNEGAQIRDRQTINEVEQ